MVMQIVRCPYCNSDKVVKNGTQKNGAQRLLCRNPDCPHTSFQLDYKNNACRPGTKQKIIDMAMNGSGTRDTGRVLHISPNTVTAVLKKTAEFAKPVNEEYLKTLANEEIEVKIVLEEVEMDEMWSYYHDKSHQVWLWWAIDHKTNTPLAYVFGTREHCNLDELLKLLKPCKIIRIYADNNFAYGSRIDDDVLVTGKKNTQKIERDHLTLRTRIKRLFRKTICFSKKLEIHNAVIGTFINIFFFGRVLDVSTIL